MNRVAVIAGGFQEFRGFAESQRRIHGNVYVNLSRKIVATADLEYRYVPDIQAAASMKFDSVRVLDNCKWSPRDIALIHDYANNRRKS